MQNLKHRDTLRHIHPILAQFLNGLTHDATIKLNAVESDAHLDKSTIKIVEVLAWVRLGSDVV